MSQATCMTSPRSKSSAIVKRKGHKSRTKRGGKRAEHHEDSSSAAEDWFSGTDFPDEFDQLSIQGNDDENVGSSSQLSFVAASPTQRKEKPVLKAAPSFSCSDGEMSMSGDEDLFASEKGRHARRRADVERHTGKDVVCDRSVSFDPFQEDEQDVHATKSAKARKTPQNELQDSFQWTELVDDPFRSAIKSSFAQKSILKKKKRAPSLTEILAKSPERQTASSSLADSFSKTDTSFHSCPALHSSISSPRSVTKESLEHSWHNKMPPSPRKKMASRNIEGANPGMYMMEPIQPGSRSRSMSRSRSRSRSRSKSRGKARSQSVDQRSDGICLRDGKDDTMFLTSDAESGTEDDLFNERFFRGPASPRVRKEETPASKTTAIATAPVSPVTKARKVTRIKIKTRGDQNIDVSKARRLIQDKMKEMKEAGELSESTSGLDSSFGEIRIVEGMGDSANLSHTTLFLDDSCVEKLGLTDTNGKKNRGDGSTASNTESLSSTDGKFGGNSSDNSTGSQNLDIGKEPKNREFTKKERRSRTKSPEKKRRSAEGTKKDKAHENKSKERGRSKSVKRSKSRSADADDVEKKETKLRARSPTKKSRRQSVAPEVSDSADREKKERKSRSKSPTKKSRSHERGRSLGPKKSSKRDEDTPSTEENVQREKSSSKRSKEERLRSKSRVRKDGKEEKSSHRKKDSRSQKEEKSGEEKEKARSKSRARKARSKSRSIRTSI
jgi:hypothetical protein